MYPPVAPPWPPFPRRPRRALHPLIVALLVIAGLVRMVSFGATGFLIYDAVTSGLSGDEPDLPRDDPSVVLPAQHKAVVDRSLTTAGYQCLTELVDPVTVIGCYRFDPDQWVDLRYRVKDGAIVGFTLNGGASDNGDAREFRAQAHIMAELALDDRAAAEAMQGVERAVARNGQVRVDTHSSDGWTGIAGNDADQYGDNFELSMSSAADHDSSYVEPTRLPGKVAQVEQTLTDLGYDCDDSSGAIHTCDTQIGFNSGGEITIVAAGQGISRLSVEWDDLMVLGDYITVLKDADPTQAKLLTTAVIRGNDGRSHHLVINGLMVASDPGSVSVYGVDWGGPA